MFSDATCYELKGRWESGGMKVDRNKPEFLCVNEKAEEEAVKL